VRYAHAVTLGAPLADPAALPKRTSFRVGPPPFLTGVLLTRLAIATVVLTAVSAPLLGASAGFFAAAGTLVALALTSIPATLVVGSDGFSVVWLWLRVFVPHGSIDGWQRSEQGVVLRARGGRPFELRTSESDRILAAVSARAGYASSAAGLLAEESLSADASLLAQAGPPAEWAAHLRRLGGAGTDYRAASLPRERLLAIVATPSLPLVLRTAAAVALGAPETEEEDLVMARAIESSASRTFSRALVDAASPHAQHPRRALVRVLRAAAREEEDARRGERR
jgi:hypothetical protein